MCVCVSTCMHMYIRACYKSLSIVIIIPPSKQPLSCCHQYLLKFFISSVDDAIGRNGLQLFIDAGQPVNNVLVTALMREVIEERVNRMLAMGHMSEATERETAVEGGSRAGGSVNQDEPDYIMVREKGD